ncbi:MAG: hypothetical protein WC324_03630, partial [Candidatus Omnitrophota bacterium]
ESQEKISAEQTKSAEDQLRLELKGRKIEAAIAKDGFDAFMDQGEEIKAYFSDLYGGAGEEIYEAISKNILADLRPDKAAERGLLEYYNPDAGMQAAATAGQNAQASPIPSSDSQTPAATQVVGATPQAPIVQEQAQPAAADQDQIRSGFANYLSQNFKGVTPESLSKYSLQQLQKANPGSWQKYSKSAAQPSATSGVGAQAASGASVSATTSKSGADLGAYQAALDMIPAGGKRDAAEAAFQKIVNEVTTGTKETLTPKETAAVKSATNELARAARNTRVAQYIRAGGMKEYVDEAARRYNQLDEGMREYIRGAGQLSTADAKLYYQGVKADLDAQKALQKAGYDAATIATKEAQLKVKAGALVLSLQDSYTRAKAALISATRTNDSNTIKAAEYELNKIDSIVKAFDVYAKAEYNARLGYRQMQNDQNKKWTKASEDQYIKEGYTEPDGVLYSSRNMAASLLRSLLGAAPEDDVMNIAAQYVIDLGGIQLGQIAPEKQAVVPALPTPGGKPQAGVKSGVFDD